MAATQNNDKMTDTVSVRDTLLMQSAKNPVDAQISVKEEFEEVEEQTFEPTTKNNRTAEEQTFEPHTKSMKDEEDSEIVLNTQCLQKQEDRVVDTQYIENAETQPLFVSQ